jgi:hypothetical protein
MFRERLLYKTNIKPFEISTGNRCSSQNHTRSHFTSFTLIHSHITLERRLKTTTLLNMTKSKKISRNGGIFKSKLRRATFYIIKLCRQSMSKPSNGSSIAVPANSLQLTWSGRCTSVLYTERDVLQRMLYFGQIARGNRVLKRTTVF